MPNAGLPRPEKGSGRESVLENGYKHYLFRALKRKMGPQPWQNYLLFQAGRTIYDTSPKANTKRTSRSREMEGASLAKHPFSISGGEVGLWLELGAVHPKNRSWINREERKERRGKDKD